MNKFLYNLLSMKHQKTSLLRKIQGLFCLINLVQAQKLY